MKGFKVVACPWRNPQNAVLQVQDMIKFREHSTSAMKDRFAGVVQTVWSGADGFLRELAAAKKDGEDPKKQKTAAYCFLSLFEEIQKCSGETAAIPRPLPARP